MTGQHLNIAQRATCAVHEPGSLGDERPPAGLGRAARQANGPIRPSEPGHDTNGSHWAAALGLNHWAVCVAGLLAQPNQRLTQLRVDWNDSPTAFLGHAIL